MEPTQENSPEATNPRENQSKRKWIIIGIIIVLIILFFKVFLSPENVTEMMLERATNGEYNVDVNKDGNMEITGSEGENIKIKAGKSASLPEGWSKTIPMLSDAVIEYSASIDGGDGSAGSTVVYVTSKSAEEATLFYKKELIENGWTIEATISTGEGSMFSAINENDDNVAINVGESEGVTTVTITAQTAE